VTYEAFLQDERTIFAVCYALQTIGECCAWFLQRDPDIEQRIPEVPWSAIRGIGNILRHEYGKINLEIVWETITGNDIAVLEQTARNELGSL